MASDEMMIQPSRIRAATTTTTTTTTRRTTRHNNRYREEYGTELAESRVMRLRLAMWLIGIVLSLAFYSSLQVGAPAAGI